MYFDHILLVVRQNQTATYISEICIIAHESFPKKVFKLPRLAHMINNTESRKF